MEEKAINNKKIKRRKAIVYIAFSLMTILLGAIVGAFIWLLLRIINGGIDLVWTAIPNALNINTGAEFGINSNVGIGLLYNLVICIIGAILIGLIQKKYGLIPDTTETVLEKIKKDGKYPYNRLGIISIAAITPLVFGATIGPEAGLVGVIAGLCYWIADSIRARRDKLTNLLKEKQEGLNSLSEVGFSVVMSIVFRAPLFGLVGKLEPDNKSEKYGKKILKKKGRIVLYVCGILGGFLAFIGLSALFKTEGGLPRFPGHSIYGWNEWKWSVVFILVGVVCGLLFLCFDKITKKLASFIKSKRILSCLIAGVVLAVVGYFIPASMLSGEHQLGGLMEQWKTIPIVILLVIAVSKMFLVNLCVNFGWRGGTIFPLIFSGVAVGYAMANITGVEGDFAVAIIAVTMYAYVSRKPATSVAIMILCFPITYIIPLAIGAFIASKIPAPWVDKKEKKDKKNNKIKEQTNEQRG